MIGTFVFRISLRREDSSDASSSLHLASTAACIVLRTTTTAALLAQHSALVRSSMARSRSVMPLTPLINDRVWLSIRCAVGAALCASRVDDEKSCSSTAEGEEGVRSASSSSRAWTRPSSSSSRAWTRPSAATRDASDRASSSRIAASCSSMPGVVMLSRDFSAPLIDWCKICKQFCYIKLIDTKFQVNHFTGSDTARYRVLESVLP